MEINPIKSLPKQRLHKNKVTQICQNGFWSMWCIITLFQIKMHHIINGLHLCAPMQLESTTRLHRIYLTAPEIVFLGSVLIPPRDVQVDSLPLCPGNGLFRRSYTFVIL